MEEFVCRASASAFASSTPILFSDKCNVVMEEFVCRASASAGIREMFFAFG
jgi:hypothetical protein